MLEFNINDFYKEAPFMFLKLVEKEFVKNILNDGQIYFNLISNYRDLQNNQNKNAVGDKTECQLTTKISLFIEDHSGKCRAFHSKQGSKAFINSNQCAFCLYAVTPQMFKPIGKNNQNIDENELCLDKVMFKKFTDTIMSDKKDGSFIIFRKNVIDKIVEELKKRNLSYGYGLVAYDNFDYIPEYEINSQKYILECCFHKLEKYSYQNEYRIVALNTKKSPIDDLYITLEKEDFTLIDL